MCKYFLPYGRLFFVLLMVSFAVQKPFNLMLFYLLMFASVAFAFGVKLKNHCLDCCPGTNCLSSRSFMVPGLTFKSLIHFQLIFVR